MDGQSTARGQGAHWLVSQPICVPVRLSFSRKKCTSSVRGSTNSSILRPLTVIVTICLLIASLPLRVSSTARRRRSNGSPRHLSRHGCLVLDVPPQILGRTAKTPHHVRNPRPNIVS